VMVSDHLLLHQENSMESLATMESRLPKTQNSTHPLRNTHHSQILEKLLFYNTLLNLNKVLIVVEDTSSSFQHSIKKTLMELLNIMLCLVLIFADHPLARFISFFNTKERILTGRNPYHARLTNCHTFILLLFVLTILMKY